MNFGDFYEQLDAEIATLNSEEEKLSQRKRLEDMLKSYQGSDRIVSSHELEQMMGGEPVVPTFGSGTAKLDEITGGFSYEQLVVITAQEKTGKTAFVLQLAEAMPEQHPCCFLFEQSPRELIRQMKSRGQTVPYFLTPALNIENRWGWIQDRAMEAMVKRGSKVFFIDNVDWVGLDKQYDERTDEKYTRLLQDMKNFCKQWGVVIFLVAHVTKMPFEEIPQPDKIKNTSAFKQIADTVLILWRKTTTEKVSGTKTKAPLRTSQTLLWVAENRRTGKTGYVQLYFDGSKLVEKTWDISLDASIEAEVEFNEI